MNGDGARPNDSKLWHPIRKTHREKYVQVHDDNFVLPADCLPSLCFNNDKCFFPGFTKPVPRTDVAAQCAPLRLLNARMLAKFFMSVQDLLLDFMLWWKVKNRCRLDEMSFTLNKGHKIWEDKPEVKVRALITPGGAVELSIEIIFDPIFIVYLTRVVRDYTQDKSRRPLAEVTKRTKQLKIRIYDDRDDVDTAESVDFLGLAQAFPKSYKWLVPMLLRAVTVLGMSSNNVVIKKQARGELSAEEQIAMRKQVVCHYKLRIVDMKALAARRTF